MHDDQFTKGQRGEFRGDFTRDTFDPVRHFSRVLMQQGRVQLDADWNEQVSIFTYLLRRLAADLIGPHGTPCSADGEDGEGFKIGPHGTPCSADGKDGEGVKISPSNNKTFSIAGGHYYVNGILCENNSENGLTFETQPDFPLKEDEKIQSVDFDPGEYLVYLDAWERHLSYIEDDYMREKALDGPDTATRARIVWQVKVKKDESINKQTTYSDFLNNLEDEIKPGTGKLKARARKRQEDTADPCLILPEAKFRGAENQLYRVEIHKSGSVQSNDNAEGNGGPTFKWSRENGSVIFPIKKIEDKTVTLEHLGRDGRYGLKPNDWVEIVDDDYILQNRAEGLHQIEEVDQDNLQVTLKDKPESLVGTDKEKHPYLRRWDQKKGDKKGVPVVESDQEPGWILLEDGVWIQFPLPVNDNSEEPHVYQTGDYWLIPARTSTGDVEWPGPEGDPEALPPQGVMHHYAPLSKITVTSGKQVEVPANGDLRRKLSKLWL